MSSSRSKHYKAGLLQNPSHSFQILVISIATPLLVGVYRNGELVETVTSEKKTSDILLPIITDIFERCPVESIIYTRSPGSYMATKLTYIMLKTIDIVRGIPCYGCSGFAFNEGQPIKAIGNLYFIKEKETIITKKYEQPPLTKFRLPQRIHDLELDEESTPEYLLTAV